MQKGQKRVWIRGIPMLLTLWLLGINLPYASGSRLSMSYLYFGSPTAYSSLVERTNGDLNEVSPNYFELHADGFLKKTASIDSAFIRQMHQQNISGCAVSQQPLGSCVCRSCTGPSAGAGGGIGRRCPGISTGWGPCQFGKFDPRTSRVLHHVCGMPAPGAGGG